MRKTTFSIPKMDCPSEERMIRMSLENVTGIDRLQFDLTLRELTVYHHNEPEDILGRLVPLKLGAKVSSTNEVSNVEAPRTGDEPASAQEEARVLRTLLLINGGMFFVEVAAGWVADSAALIADSLDMFADAAVYAISLYGVSRSSSVQRKAAGISGILQLGLAAWALIEVGRRFALGSEPQPSYMMIVAFVALIANVSCLLLLARHRGGGAHMKASWIFSTNDVIANAGVIIAGAVVMFTSSSIPDLVIGLIIGVIVLLGAIKILKLASRSV